MAIPPLGVHENTLFRGRTGAAEDAWWQLADCKSTALVPTSSESQSRHSSNTIYKENSLS
jgi:hypothetical protein